VKPNYPESLEELGTPEEGSSSKPEYEEFPPSMDQLKARVYSLLRENADVPFASPNQKLFQYCY
jgi:hypothetical protein